MAFILLPALLLTSVDAGARQTRKKTVKQTRQTSAPARSMETVKKEQDAARLKISETSTRIETTGVELRRQLNRLNTINADMETTSADVDRLRTHIDSIGSHITATSDSIAILERDLESLRQAYAQALRRLQPAAGHLNKLSFIFSARSFAEARARIRYLNRFARWRERKAEDINLAIDRIAERRRHLTGLRHAQDRAYRQAEDARQKLVRQQEESKKLVSSLQSRNKELQTELANQKRKAAALDKELDRLIAAEQAKIAREEAARKKAQGGGKSGGNSSSSTPSSSSSATTAEERRAADTDPSGLSGSFESCKGRMLFPVAGSYKLIRKFGRQPHPTLPHVMTDNAGIDVEVSGGTAVRAVFGGTVSAIFKQDGFNSIVMLRHGRYLTVYAGLGSVAVRKGETVKAGQTLGSLFSDPANYDKGTLHFEIRDERRKLNPLQWVK